MPKHPSRPTCPSCGYDLSGLAVSLDNCRCPECGKDSINPRIEVEERTHILRHATIWLWILPLFHATVCWVLLITLPLQDLILPLVLTLIVNFLFISGYALLTLRNEASAREAERSYPDWYRVTPPLYRIQWRIVAGWIVSTVVILPILFRWMLLAG